VYDRVAEMWAADIAKATDDGKTHVSSVMSTIKKKAKVLTRSNLQITIYIY
jgi:hypothetical protein